MSYKVYGYVKRNDNGQSLPGLKVKAYDVDWISSDDYLGQSTTDANGRFEIRFNSTAFDAGWYDPEGGPDIILKVYHNNRLIRTTNEKGGAGENTYFFIRLDPMDLLGEYTVDGTVTDARTGRKLCNLKAKAYDDDWIFDDYLGTDSTNHQGNYLIPFNKFNFSGAFEGNPDVYVKVLNNSGKVLAKSSTRDEAPKHSTKNISIPGQEISWQLSECIYGWTAKYRQEGTHIIVKIRLDPDDNVTNEDVETLKERWKAGIEEKWSNKFASKCTTPGCNNKHNLTFEVKWVSSGEHHKVRIRRGPERSNMLCWDTNDTGNVASHEFGHMLGLVDEYPDGNCPSRSPVNTGTVMDDNTEVVERHVEHLAALLNENAVPIFAAPELLGIEWAVLTRKTFTLEKKDKYKMCLLPDLKVRKDLKLVLKDSAKSKSLLNNKDKIIHTIGGGADGKRIVQKLELSFDGKVQYQNNDQLRKKNELYSTTIEQRSVKSLLQSINATNILDLKEAGGPFLPDSVVGNITIEIGGKSTTFYYLADAEQRRDQGIIMKQAIAILEQDLNRLKARTIKRDTELQNRIKGLLQ